MAQLQADAAKLESRGASYDFGYRPMGPSLMCSSQAEGATEVSLGQGYSEPSKLPYRKFRSIASCVPMQGHAEVELRSTAARWGLLGRKRLADKNEEGCENEHLAKIRRVRKMFAEQSTVQKPANVRSVPMVFPY